MSEEEDADTQPLGRVRQPVPPHLHALTHEQRVATFGRFDFTPEPQPGNYEHVTIDPAWTAANLITIQIPQLPNRSVELNKLIRWQFVGLWQAWQDAGLLPLVLSFDGAWVPRFKRGRADPPHGLEADLSNHAWGTAFDVNAPWNRFGSSPLMASSRGATRELVPLAERWGFAWGGHFHDPYCDAMHFEVARVTSKPPPDLVA